MCRALDSIPAPKKKVLCFSFEVIFLLSIKIVPYRTKRCFFPPPKATFKNIIKKDEKFDIFICRGVCVPSPPLVINVRYNTALGGSSSPDVLEGKGVCSLLRLACPALQAVDVPSLLVLLPAQAALRL